MYFVQIFVYIFLFFNGVIASISQRYKS